MIQEVKVNKMFNNKTLKDFFDFYYVSSKYYDNYNLNLILKENDILKFDLKEKIDYIPTYYNLDILYEDEFLLIINKEAKVMVHPDSINKTNTLCNYVAYHYYQTKQFIRVRYCHRLDNDTSGIIVFAKGFFVHSYLNHLWEEKNIKREYLAITLNKFKNKIGTVNEKIAMDRHSKNKRRVSKTGKTAITHYEVVKQINKFSVVKLNLETGRTHQIRVHMAHINHPLLGDTIYNVKSDLIDRTALHSSKIEFNHPIYFNKIIINCNMPYDMQKVINKEEK